MGKIYLNQTALKITAITKVDVTTAITLKIKYRKPGGDDGDVEATVVDGSTNKIEFIVIDPSILNEVGKWTFWSWVEFEVNKWAPGEPFIKEVFKEGY